MFSLPLQKLVSSPSRSAGSKFGAPCSNGFSQPFHRGEAALSVSREGGSAHADFPGARGAVAEAPFPSLLVLLDVLLLFSAISFIPKNVLYEPLIFDM